jgi:hypothetical protein
MRKSRRLWRRSAGWVLTSLASAVITGVALAGPASADPPMFKLVNRQTNECLTIGDNNPGWAYHRGENVRIWSCSTGSNAQLWYRIDTAYVQSQDGAVRPAITLKSASDPRWCMDVQWGSVQDNADIWLWDCNDTTAQKFVPSSFDGTWNFLINAGGLNANRSQCVDKASWEVLQYSCDSSKWWQQWKFVPVNIFP